MSVLPRNPAKGRAFRFGSPRLMTRMTRRHRGEFELSITPPLKSKELNDLYRASWPNHTDADHSQVLERSLAYICIRHRGHLVGFVYIAWDGGRHAFLLDPTVHPTVRGKGIGLELIKQAVLAAKERGCDWLHVDYEEELEPFYKAAGFRPTKAGLIRLSAD
jgi:GNAT superfamily N-acetyltransferase